MNDLKLPERRVLPDAVRERMRAKLDEGMNRRPRRGTHLAAAAAVVVLAGSGAVVVSQLGEPEPVATPPPPREIIQGPGLDAALAARELDRCWAAVRTSGRTLPDRSTWVPVFTVAESHYLQPTVVAARVDGKPLFCVTTRTTVTVSDPGATPGYAPGTRTGVLLASANGIVAGVADPGWDEVMVHAFHAGGSSAEGGIPVGEGLFATAVSERPEGTTYAVAPYREAQPNPAGPVNLPPAPAPLVSIEDRPVAPVDRVSEAGRFLGDCLAKSRRPVSDPQSYEPGVLLSKGYGRLVTGRADGAWVTCAEGLSMATTDVNVREQHAMTLPLGDGPPVRVIAYDTVNITATPGGEGNAMAEEVITGVVPAGATRMTLAFGDRAPVEVAVANGSFALWQPENVRVPGPNNSSDLPPMHAKVYDGAGKLLYDGPLHRPG
ncbi:hypothetical protein [Amycolatopsis suaedae]|uniref:Uncharacterized protein n=1 Tax=Amycolatopsis suaedae TaxID=2510978 RepID=A0A4Q7J562_9PSEU|nr:hypothetical protein [Amycolatopsis suaedae]RZQ61968.1 hypothetical protein EWH70_20375 [Amycolatopsis suaedae]